MAEGIGKHGVVKQWPEVAASEPVAPSETARKWFEELCQLRNRVCNQRREIERLSVNANESAINAALEEGRRQGWAEERLQQLRAGEEAFLAKMRNGTLSLDDFSPELRAAAAAVVQALQAKTSTARLSGDAEREALAERIKAEELADIAALRERREVNVPAAGLSGGAEREALTETLLQGMCDAIEQDLLSYRCTNIVDADDGQHGFPLTDLLTLPGDKDIKRGQDEIHMIVDSIYHAIKPLLSAALHSTGKPDGDVSRTTPEQDAEVDAKLGLELLPPIRVNATTAGLLRRFADLEGVILQAFVRHILDERMCASAATADAPVAEPVGEVLADVDHGVVCNDVRWIKPLDDIPAGSKLYTHPPTHQGDGA